jgi:ubiquinone/menaquinone biosynthesis C-methylase UbiE
VKDFDIFYVDENYIKIKNSYFNYRNRKTSIRKCFYKHITYSEDLIMVDVGVGISPVSPKPKHTLFIDFAKEAINYLQKQGYQAKYGDIIDLPLETNYADVIFCSEVLEHVEHYKTALKEMHRILKNGGNLILTVPVHQKYWDFEDEHASHLQRFDPEFLRQDITDVGFRIIEEKPIGSWLERELSKLGVRIFLRQKNKGPLGKSVILASGVANCILYLAVRASLLFTSKNSTSIMLYCCRKE